METIPGSPKIAVVPCFGINCAASLFQTQTIFNASYDWERNEIVDLTKQKGFKELLLDIFADYQGGVLVDIETIEQVNGNACAYIGFSGAGWDRYDIPEGYKEYVLTPQKYLSTPGGGSYGISAFSEKRISHLRFSPHVTRIRRSHPLYFGGQRMWIDGTKEPGF